MLAMVKTDAGPGYAIQEWLTPTPSLDEVLLRVRRVGLSPLDRAVLRGDIAVQLPRIPGCAMVGEVIDYGRAVHGWKTGDRVTVNPLGVCGACAMCALNRSALCERLVHLGIDRDGGLAEYCAVPAASLFHLPDEMEWATAALVDPLARTLPATIRSSIMYEDTVVVMGDGLPGLLVAQLARLVGPLRIIHLGQHTARLALARVWADAVVNVVETDAVDTVLGLTDGRGADVVIEASGHASAVNTALSVAGRAGRVVLMGRYAQPSPIAAYRITEHELLVYGTRGYSRQEFLQALTMLVSRNVQVNDLVTHTLPLLEIEPALALTDQQDAIHVQLKPG